MAEANEGRQTPGSLPDRVALIVVDVQRGFADVVSTADVLRRLPKR